VDVLHGLVLEPARRRLQQQRLGVGPDDSEQTHVADDHRLRGVRDPGTIPADAGR